jgi:hypothetical protein
MKSRGASLITLAVLVVSSCLSTTSGQTRRRVPQTKKRTPAVKYEPLTEDQKRSISEILEAARALEVTYQYDPSRYYDESSALAGRAYNFTPTLPDGAVKNSVFLMARAYEDAGYLYSTIFPHRETEGERIRREATESLERLQKSQGMRPADAETYSDRQAKERNSRIASILRFYGIESLSPYQAREHVFARAQVTRRLVEATLPKVPTAPKAVSSP